MTPVVPFEIPLEIRELSRNITRPPMQMLTSSGKLVYCLKDFALSDKFNIRSPSQSMAGQIIGVRERLCAMKSLMLRAVSRRATMKVDFQMVFAMVNCSWRSCKRAQDLSGNRGPQAAQAIIMVIVDVASQGKAMESRDEKAVQTLI